MRRARRHGRHIVSRSGHWAATVILIMLLVVACMGDDETPVATPALSTAGELTPTPLTGTPDVSGTGPSSASPTAAAQPTPTTIASGDYLEIDGARVRIVLIPSEETDAEYAVARGVLYRQVSAGDWEEISTGVGDEALVVDPTRPDILYRGGHPPCAVGGQPIPFQKSTDGGRTWQTIPSGEDVQPLLVDPTDPDVLYGDRCMLAISTDAGHNWKTFQLVPNFDVSSLSLVGDRLYGTYTSEGGTSRLVGTDVSDPADPTTGSTLLEFWGGGVVSAGRDRLIVGEPRGVHVSRDGGQTWEFSREGLEDVTVSVDPRTEPIPPAEMERRFGIFAIAAHPSQGDRIFLGTTAGLYLSENGGETWGRTSEVPAVRVRRLAFGMDGGVLYVTIDDGVVVLENP